MEADAILPAEEQQPDQFEPEAGLITQLVKKIKKVPAGAERKILQKDIQSGKVGAYTVIREDAPVNEILNKATTTTASGKPSPTQAQIDAGVQKTVFNLDQIKDVDGVRQFIEATALEYGADKLPKISYKEVAEKAALDGYDERFLARILDPKVQTTASPEEAYKMLLAITDAGKRAFDLGQQGIHVGLQAFHARTFGKVHFTALVEHGIDEPRVNAQELAKPFGDLFVALKVLGLATHAPTCVQGRQQHRRGIL
jgi:hypothetical protein